MKILDFRLTAFGHFTDASLDLSAGSEGMHIVYGANEAGKSTALRALRSFFYRIPARSDDNFL
ncbi:MAG: AAA family ATPase, partial [Candidatus Poribacteria bacterium]